MSNKIPLGSKEERDIFIATIKSQQDFDAMLEEIKRNDNPYGNRLAWALTTLCEDRPELLVKHYDDLVMWLPSIKTKGIHRSMLRSVVELGYPNTEEGRWVDYLCETLEQVNMDVAVKVHAMQILFNFTKVYPDLAHELRLIIEEQYEKQTPAFKARARRILKRL